MEIYRSDAVESDVPMGDSGNGVSVGADCRGCFYMETAEGRY